MKLDAVDLILLNLLQRDGKPTMKWLAQQCNLSSTAVFERVKRLENNGIIQRYVALLDNHKIGKSLRVFCQVALNQHVKTNVIRFENEVSELPEVVSCYHIGGAYDYMLEILVRDMQEYRDFLIGKLTAIHHIGSTQSAFVISEVKQTTEIPLD